MFSAEGAQAHVTALSKQVGPRLAASVTERSAAYYVQKNLQGLGLASERQQFHALERFSKRLMPQLALSAATLGSGLNLRRGWRWLPAVAGLVLTWHYRRVLLGYPALWESAFAESPSHNVLCQIPAQKEAKKRVVLVAHLDTSFHRPSFNPGFVGLLPHLLTLAGGATLLGGLLSIFDREWSRQARTGLASYLMLSTLLAALDEFNNPVVGANDNASGIGVVLALAEHLAQVPLEHTEVWLLFTGSERVGGAGMDAFLQQNAAQFQDATFILLNAVGAGELCWVTDHSLSSAMHYRPHPAAMQLAERAAAQNPHLGVMGRAMLTLDEIAVLNRYGMKGVALMGYDRLSGRTPNRHRDSDTLEAIETRTLETALHFTWAMLQAAEATALIKPSHLASTLL